MNMKLTSEEIALIEQKREEKRLMKLQSANLYAEYKENRINAETKRCENIKNDAEELKATYESNFNELIKISKDFVLECKKVEQKRTLDLYDVNEEGYEVRSEKPKEIINFMSYHYSLKIKYAGLVPKGHEYYVTMIPQYSKYSGRVNGYKMQIQGTGIYTWDRRGQMTNPSKLDLVKSKISIGNKGKTVDRDSEWQNKIIDSKRKNGTLKHSNETKSKIGDGLNKYHSLNLDREKYISKSNNISHFCGWYNGLYFRSSLELSFLFINKEVSFTSCEKNKYKIIYEKDGKQKVYYPDYTDGDIIYEIKPSTLLEYKDNDLKIKKGLELYGDKYKVITEKEAPYIEKTKILELIETGIVRVNEKSLKILEKYKH